MNRNNRILNIFKNPIVLIVSAALGFYIGIWSPAITGKLGVFADFYIKALKLFAFPLLFAVVTLSIANLVKYPQFKIIIGRIILWFSAAVLFAALLGFALGAAAKPGVGLIGMNGDDLGNIIHQYKLNMILNVYDKAGEGEEGIDSELLDVIVSGSEESSLNNGNAIVIVLFSIVLGISIALIRHRQSDLLIDFFDSISSGFQKVVDIGIFFLPFAIICLMSQISIKFDINKLIPLSLFVVIFCSAALGIVVLGSLIIWMRSGQKFSIVVKGILEPVLVAFSTGSSLATMPFSLNVMSRELKFNKETISLTITLGQSLGRFGNIFYFSLAAMFAAQLYSVELSLTSYLLIVTGAVIAGFVSAGSSSITTLSLITLILSPLKIPVEPVLLLLLFIDPVINPFRTLLIVFFNMVIASLVAKPRSCFDDDVVPGILMQNLPEDVNLREYFSNYDGDVPLISMKKNEFLTSAFPKARFKEYKKWESVEASWNSFDIHLVIGNKDYMKNISMKSNSDSKLVVLNRRH